MTVIFEVINTVNICIFSLSKKIAYTFTLKKKHSYALFPKWKLEMLSWQLKEICWSTKITKAKTEIKLYLKLNRKMTKARSVYSKINLNVVLTKKTTKTLNKLKTDS